MQVQEEELICSLWLLALRFALWNLALRQADSRFAAAGSWDFPVPRRERVVSDGADVLTMSRWRGVRALCLCCAVHRSQESLQVDVSLLASVLQDAS